VSFGVLALLFALGTAIPAQDSTRLYAVLTADDTAALRTEVRRRPADARDVLGDLIDGAGRATPVQADSLLRLSRKLASAYASAWADSFPLTNLSRFEAMSRGERAAKVVADSLRRAGNDALGAKGVPRAMNLWRSALRRSRAINDTAGMAASLGNIGAGFYLASEFDSAARNLRAARQLAERIGDHRTAVNAIGTLGSIAKDRGELAEAQRAYASALGIRQRIGDVVGESADHNNLGLIAAVLGDAPEARKHYSEALRIARDHSLDDATATALLNLGNLAAGEADYPAAASRYREALSLYKQNEDFGSAALILHNLGLLALRTGDYVTARSRLREALALFVRVGTPEDLVEVRKDLAAVNAGMGNLQDAIAQLRAAQRLLPQIPRSFDLAGAVALAQADLSLQLNDYPAAERQYEEAQKLYRRAGNGNGEVAAREGRAALLVDRDQYAAAESQLEAVLRAQVAAGDRRSAALTRLDLGRVYLQAGDTSSARRLISQATIALRALGDPIGEAAGSLAMGDLELQAASPVAAEAHYRRGLATIAGRRAPGITWPLHAGLGEALHARGALGDAATQLRAAIEDVERITRTLSLSDRRSVFLTDKWAPYARLALIERERGDAESSFAVSERMRARQMLETFARGAVAHPTSADPALVAREQELRDRIAGLTQLLEPSGRIASFRGPGPAEKASDASREALVQAQDEYQHVLVELNESTGGSTNGAAVSGWRLVARRLAPDQAMLEYLVTDSTTIVFIVRPDTIQTLDLGVGSGALTPLVDFARATLGTRGTASTRTSWRAPMRRLYAQLIAPIEESGALAKVRELVIVPHAELHYLPFAALLSADREEFLIQRYEIGYAPSASMWLRLGARGSSDGKKVLALAPKPKALPGSRSEVDAIRALYREATILTDEAATEAAFRAHAGRVDVIHLATNGVLNRRNPLFSFVELGAGGGDDGRLEVHEVFGLTLHARLLVLSACETGLGSGAISDVPAGDDWVGLVRAFLGAGAQNVIATLWAVEDRSTGRVMERLYARLSAGDAEVTALSRAQRETIRNPATAGPFYWAGFVNVGGAAGR
jgi:CHAT domain-containing protein/tetratricopeptide (TPR) repeat protein